VNLNDVVQNLGLEIKAGRDALETEVRGGYVSDLMSDVIAHSREGDLWVTLQTHQNTIAVASLKGLAGIVLVNGRQPDEEMLKKAIEENIVILASSLPAFELVGRLHNLGISGKRM
jgi:hypothetical protein